MQCIATQVLGAPGGISSIDVNLGLATFSTQTHRLDTPIWPAAGASVAQRRDEKCRSEPSARWMEPPVMQHVAAQCHR